MARVVVPAEVRAEAQADRVAAVLATARAPAESVPVEAVDGGMARDTVLAMARAAASATAKGLAEPAPGDRMVAVLATARAPAESVPVKAVDGVMAQVLAMAQAVVVRVTVEGPVELAVVAATAQEAALACRERTLELAIHPKVRAVPQK